MLAAFLEETFCFLWKIVSLWYDVSHVCSLKSHPGKWMWQMKLCVLLTRFQVIIKEVVMASEASFGD